MGRVKIPTRVGQCYPRCAPTYGPGASRSHRLVSGLIPGGPPPVPNGLLNNLIAYWPGNEVNGNALDAHTNALHLTDTNTVTSNPGHVYALARQYTAANAEYHNRVSEALLQAGDVEVTFAAWAYAGSFVNYPMILGKHTNEYRLWYNTAAPICFHFNIGGGAGSVGIAQATTHGVAAINTWILVVAWHDPTTNRVYIQINDGVVDSAATTGPAGVAANDFSIGRGPSNYWNGRIGPTAMWKSAAGAGGVLDATKRTALWNGGAGLPYAEFTL